MNQQNVINLPSDKDLHDIYEKMLVQGDLANLSTAERIKYYHATCKSLGLNPLTRPFEYLKLNGKLVLYVRKDGAEQLRKVNGVSITRTEIKEIGNVYIVIAYARDREGREDVATGAVSIKGLSDDAISNAMMKTETKAKRRVTLSICGLGWLDETEIDSIHDAQKVIDEEEMVEHYNALFETAKSIDELRTFYTQAMTEIPKLEMYKTLKQKIKELSDLRKGILLGVKELMDSFEVKRIDAVPIQQDSLSYLNECKQEFSEDMDSKRSLAG